MKNISYFKPSKYEYDSYIKIEDNIYKFKDLFVTSLSFSQESELNEGKSPKDISQYPLEDILDKFLVHIEDFYEELNNKSEDTCYLEFASLDIKDIKNLHTIIGKHVYNKTIKKDGQKYEILVVE